MGAGGALGYAVAQKVGPTELPQTVAAFHSLVRNLYMTSTLALVKLCHSACLFNYTNMVFHSTMHTVIAYVRALRLILTHYSDVPHQCAHCTRARTDAYSKCAHRNNSMRTLPDKLHYRLV
jgi:hypothetical protein